MLGGLMCEKMGRAKRREERVREERLVAWWRRQKDQEEGEGEARSENEEEEQCWVVFQVWRLTGHDTAAKPAVLLLAVWRTTSTWCLLVVWAINCCNEAVQNSPGTSVMWKLAQIWVSDPVFLWILLFCFDCYFNKRSTSFLPVDQKCIFIMTSLVILNDL